MSDLSFPCRYLGYDDGCVSRKFVGRHVVGCQEQVGLAVTVVALLILRRDPLDVVRCGVFPGNVSSL